MRPSSFAYHKADSVDHALQLLATLEGEVRPLAGGQSLVPMMNLRLARPEHLVDINGLPLDRIEVSGRHLRLGALVRHQRQLTVPSIERHFPALRQAVTCIGHPTIRGRGTLGGSISHADPSAELPLICVLHDAVILVRSMRGERRIPAADFFLGAFMTVLQPGELVTAVDLPIPPPGSAGSFVEFAERRGDFAMASVGVAIEVSGRSIARAAVACTGAEFRPIRAPAVERSLAGRPLETPEAAEAGRLLAAGISPIEDHLASADYRRSLIGELARRAIEAACARALEAQ